MTAKRRSYQVLTTSGVRVIAFTAIGTTGANDIFLKSESLWTVPLNSFAVMAGDLDIRGESSQRRLARLRKNDYFSL